MNEKTLKLAAMNGMLKAVYDQEVEKRVAMRYTHGKETAILRKAIAGDTEEYAVWFDFVEGVKQDVKNEMLALGYEV
jgi:hypothetical protein